MEGIAVAFAGFQVVPSVLLSGDILRVCRVGQIGDDVAEQSGFRSVVEKPPGRGACMLVHRLVARRRDDIVENEGVVSDISGPAVVSTQDVQADVVVGEDIVFDDSARPKLHAERCSLQE